MGKKPWIKIFKKSCKLKFNSCHPKLTDVTNMEEDIGNRQISIMPSTNHIHENHTRCETRDSVGPFACTFICFRDQVILFVLFFIQSFYIMKLHAQKFVLQLQLQG